MITVSGAEKPADSDGLVVFKGKRRLPPPYGQGIVYYSRTHP